MQKSIDSFIGDLQCVVLFDYQPHEAMTSEYPGCPAATEVEDVTVTGVRTSIIEDLSEECIERLNEECMASITDY